ncbi:MAG: hypothetical protein ACLTGQ_10665 [Mediterraneibacter gnavus]
MTSSNFNTPATINAIGIATSDISEMALQEISASSPKCANRS